MTAVTIPTLRTDRLTLRAPGPDDFAPFARFVERVRPGFIGGLDREHAGLYFSAEIASWVTHGYGKFVVTADDAPVGMVGVARQPHWPEPEIGWMIFDGHQREGYATEAATVALGWARGRVASLVSYVSPENAASAALARRLGASIDADAARPDGEGSGDADVWRHWSAA